MLSKLRNFSKTKLAGVLIGLIIIPFVFWGMGSLVRGGSKNIVVVIDKDKYSIQQFSDFIRQTARKKIEANQVEEFLSAFIGEKLIKKEVDYFGINLSDKSLSKLIRHQKDFKRENKFSRVEYEKFLLKNNITAVNFESIISHEEKKKQLLDFIGGGIMPSKFLVNISYDNINQKRSIELINLNDAFRKKLKFSENQIRNYFEKNKDKYVEIYKSIKILELTPKKLVGNDDFNDLFFKKIDEIDDSIMRGEELNYILQKFNLEKPNLSKINKFGKNIDSGINENIPKYLIERIFDINNDEPISLIENKNKYFIVEISKSESIQRDPNDKFVKKEILLDLEKITKRKLTAEIIDKINKNNFKKYDFDQLSKNESVEIRKIYLKNQNDDDSLKKGIVNQIYKFPEKRIIVVNEFGLSENYLIYIDKIKNVTIDTKSEEYQKYLDLSKNQITNSLYNTYDSYLNKRYKIDINYQALDTVKNYFN